MTLTPYPPMIDRPLPDKFGAGMSFLDRWTPENKAEATWGHRMFGWLWSTDTYFRFPHVQAATDYGIGGEGDGDSDGVIFRWINYHVRRQTAGWASGWSDHPDFSAKGRVMYDALGHRAINGTGRSIEFSGLDKTPVSSKQYASGIHLFAAIHHHELKQGYEEFAWRMKHADVAEKLCWFWWMDQYEAQFDKAVVLVMKHYETGQDIPDFLMFGDVKVMLPGGMDVIEPTPAPEKPIFVPFAKRIAFTTRPGALSRQWGNVSAAIVRSYPTGTIVRCNGYYHGQEVAGRNEWLVIQSPGQSNNARIHISGVKEEIPSIYLTGLVS